MNIFLNEYFGFCFELNFELNHFSARFNEKMNFQNVSNTPSGRGEWREVEERVSSGEGGERLQLVGSWRRSWSRAGVGVGGVGGVDGGGGETQSWSRAGATSEAGRVSHTRPWHCCCFWGLFATRAAGVSLSLACQT